MKYFLRTIANVLLWTVSFLLLFLVISGLVQRFLNKNGYTGLFGIGYAVVVSGSMIPTFQIDDMIIYQEHEVDEYHTGDIVVYVRDAGTDREMLITHRIVDMTSDFVTTQGDANNRADDPITYSQLVGKVVWKIGKVGKVVTFLRSTKGLIILVIGLGLILLIDLYVTLFRHRKKKVETVQGKEYLRY